MNQIYKVIWSRVKRCYVVVSEIAGSNGKNGGVASKKESLPFHAFLCALALTGCLMPSVAEANTVHGPGASATGGDSVAIGDSAKATAGHATAVGTLTEADGVNSFVAGLQAKSGATAENSVAIGRGAQALGQKRASDQFTASTIAIGNNATATETGISSSAARRRVRYPSTMVRMAPAPLSWDRKLILTAPGAMWFLVPGRKQTSSERALPTRQMPLDIHSR